MEMDPATEPASVGLSRFGALLLGVGALTALLAATAVMGELRGAADLLTDVEAPQLALIVALAAANHGVRYARWHVLLGRVAGRALRPSAVALVFGAGSLLIFTPARAGEMSKSIYARDRLGVPVATSLPVLLAERLADVAVMAVMGGLGLLLLGKVEVYWAVAVVLGGGLVASKLGGPLLRRVAAGGRRLPLLTPRVWDLLKQANASRATLMARRPLAINLELGSLAWALEVAVYIVSLAATGVHLDSHVALVALAVYPLSALLAALSMLPAGLGVAEGGLVALAVTLGGLSADAALAAALLSRVAVLGVVVAAGLLSATLMQWWPRPAGG